MISVISAVINKHLFISSAINMLNVIKIPQFGVLNEVAYISPDYFTLLLLPHKQSLKNNFRPFNLIVIHRYICNISLTVVEWF